MLARFGAARRCAATGTRPARTCRAVASVRSSAARRPLSSAAAGDADASDAADADDAAFASVSAGVVTRRAAAHVDARWPSVTRLVALEQWLGLDARGVEATWQAAVGNTNAKLARGPRLLGGVLRNAQYRALCARVAPCPQFVLPLPVAVPADRAAAAGGADESVVTVLASAGFAPPAADEARAAALPPPFELRFVLLEAYKQLALDAQRAQRDLAPDALEPHVLLSCTFFVDFAPSTNRVLMHGLVHDVEPPAAALQLDVPQAQLLLNMFQAMYLSDDNYALVQQMNRGDDAFNFEEVMARLGVIGKAGEGDDDHTAA